MRSSLRQAGEENATLPGTYLTCTSNFRQVLLSNLAKTWQSSSTWIKQIQLFWCVLCCSIEPILPPSCWSSLSSCVSFIWCSNLNFTKPNTPPFLDHSSSSCVSSIFGALLMAFRIHSPSTFEIVIIVLYFNHLLVVFCAQWTPLTCAMLIILFNLGCPLQPICPIPLGLLIHPLTLFFLLNPLQFIHCNP